MATPTEDLKHKIEALLILMGWRKNTPGTRWIKLYPPPQELPNPTGHSRVIAVQGSVDWMKDLHRAREMVERPDPSIPMPLADYRWSPPD